MLKVCIYCTILIATELCDANLRNFLADTESQNMVLIILQQVIEGLIYIRNKKLIHGDIKPENILIVHKSSDNRASVKAKIGDFGLSR